MRLIPLAAAALLWLAAGPVRSADDPAPAATPAARPSPAPLAEFVSPADSLPRLRYLADGLVTLNDRCPVRKVKLNPRMEPAYVNGFPVGFC